MRNCFSPGSDCSDIVYSIYSSEERNYKFIIHSVEEIKRIMFNKDVEPYTYDSMSSKSCHASNADFVTGYATQRQKMIHALRSSGYLSVSSQAPPVQFKNNHNSCFASSLVQNIMSLGPMQHAIMNSDLSELGKSTEMKLGYNHI